MPAPRTLTDLQVRNLRAKPQRYMRLFADGFGVRVAPSGEKTFVFWYSKDGRKRLLTLGRYPAVSLKEALAKHAAARSEVLRGDDPAGTVAEQRGAPTVQLLVDEFAAHVLSKQPSGKNTLRQIEKDILPGLGAKTKLPDLKRRDAVLIVDKVRKRGDRIGNAAAAILARLGKYAVERGLLDANPFAALKKVSIAPKTRVLADWELARVWDRLPRVDMDPGTAIALRMVLVTGQRPGEVAGMRWDEITGDLWAIPASRYKTGTAQKVPLSPLALDLLQQAAAYAGGSAYVFPSPRPGVDDKGRPRDVPIDRHTLSRAVLRKLGDAPDTDALAPAADGTLSVAPFTPHDLRRTCRTGMAALGVPDAVAEKVIGHKLEGMLAVYNVHEYLDEKRDALCKWADHIVRLLAGPQKK